MAEYLIQGDTLADIADAIRVKCGTASKIFPTDMADYIRNIPTAEVDSSEVPEDVVTEATRVVNNMLPKIGSNSLTFIAMSDTHELAEDDMLDQATVAQYRRANKNAGQAAKLIADRMSLDFFCHLGDVAWGGSATPTDQGLAAIKRVYAYNYPVIDSVPSFLTPGNHDSLSYSYDSTGVVLSSEVMSSLIGTYRYHDFEAKLVRVICLNTADNAGSSMSQERISGEQLQWFAESLDLSNKDDPSAWSIIILSHHPLDWCYIKPAANCLAAYVEGTAYATTHEGVAVSYDFAGKNSAKVIAQFHGHVHGFLVDQIRDFRTGSAVLGTVKRVAVPNACFGRNNEYGRNDKTEWDGIEFGETETYNKSDDSTGKNTAFCVVCIDLDSQVIYADCFGAGYDRVINYGDVEVVTYSVSAELSQASAANTANAVIEGHSYSNTISALSGYAIDQIRVSMGGEDITSSAVDGCNINIPLVTGDIEIVVTTLFEDTFSYGTFTNLVPSATSTFDGDAIYNDIGYKDGAYVSSGGAFGTDSNTVAVGYLKFSPSDVVYIRCPQADITTNSHVRLYTNTSSGTAYYYSGTLTDVSENQFNWVSTTGDVIATVTRLADRYYKLIWNASIFTESLYGYRISLYGIGDGLVITHNEPIHSDGAQPTVTYQLTGASSYNNDVTVDLGASYHTQLALDSKYNSIQVKVMMGGLDVTSSVYSNLSIDIPQVTGDIEIMVTGSVYTNLVPTSIGTDKSIFNVDETPGYMDGTYASMDHYYTDSAFVTTGYIWLDKSVDSIYIRGATWNMVDRCRIRIFAESSLGTQSVAYSIHGDSTPDGESRSSWMGLYFKFTELAENYYKLELLEANRNNICDHYYCVSLLGTGENLVITHDQEIVR